MKPLLAAFASPQDLMNAYQGATEEQEQKEKEYWPEYIYAKKRDTKCFLCGVSPLPTSQHINPNDDRTSKEDSMYNFNSHGCL
jgi:hypothetical protein